jgi:class 3 adenylate cyclase
MASAGRKERKVVTVVFADLVGFTARAESLDPEDVQAVLEPYHARLRGELERLGGTVEKFIGDAVVAVYAHLRAAESLAAAGHRSQVEAHARQANDFYSSVGAAAYVRRGESLLAVSA